MDTFQQHFPGVSEAQGAAPSSFTKLVLRYGHFHTEYKPGSIHGIHRHVGLYGDRSPRGLRRDDGILGGDQGLQGHHLTAMALQ